MADAKILQYSVVTPESVVAEGHADFVALPGHDGEFGIMAMRAPLLCRLAPGIVRVQGRDQTQRFFVAGGFGHVLRNQVTILAPRALPASEVTRDMADEALQRAGAIKVTDEESLARRSDAAAEARALRKLASHE